MAYIFSTTMIYLLTMVIGILIGAIVYLNIQFYNEKKDFTLRLYALQDIILEISKKQLGHQEQLKLSEELEKTLKSTNAKLNSDIFGLHYDLFEIASKNNLI